MKTKKIIALFAAVVMTASIFVGCDGESAKKGAEIKVGLSTDEGGLNDKSFNQSADAGIKQAVDEFGIKYSPLEATGPEDFVNKLEELTDAGCKLVYGVGYMMFDAITDVSSKYPDTNYVIIDTIVDKPNVRSYMFKEQEGSFLMGVIAGKMTKNNKVGFIGGRDSDTINHFEAGFAAGVITVNPEAGALLMGRNTVKYVDSFDNVEKGKESAKALYDDGCDIIYHAAGSVGNGLFQATKELRDAGNDVWAIGVDMDQAVTTDYGDYILSSMIKRVDKVTYDAVKDLIEGNFEGGKTVTLGLKDGAIGIAPSTSNNTPQDVIDLVEKYEKAIIDGKFEVPATIDELAEFEIPEI